VFDKYVRSKRESNINADKDVSRVKQKSKDIKRFGRQAILSRCVLYSFAYPYLVVLHVQSLQIRICC
jgi:hypothetical protein